MMEWIIEGLPMLAIFLSAMALGLSISGKYVDGLRKTISQKNECIDNRDRTIEKITEELRESLKLTWLSAYEICQKYQAQNCGVCDRMECCDNTSNAKQIIKELEERLEVANV